MKNPFNFFALAVASFIFIPAARAIPVNYTDLNAFNAAAGNQSAIRFTELAEGVTVGSQYVNLGVLFTDLNDTTLADIAFLSDGFGLHGHGGVTLQFSSYLTALGALFPGALTIGLFSDGQSIGSSAAFGGSGEGFFGGVTSDIPFNRVVLSDWSDGRVFIDNLYLQSPTGPSVPDTGSTGALLGISVAVMAVLIRYARRETGRRSPS